MKFLDKVDSLKGTVTVPSSKSITNRLLLMAALNSKDCTLRNPLRSDDTTYMLQALKTLGVEISECGQDLFVKPGIASGSAEIFLGNAGTAMRSLTAALSFMDGNYILRGVPRMHLRPIGDLVDAVNSIGANVQYLERDGFPPLSIGPSRIVLNHIHLKADISSQFISSLIIASVNLKDRFNEFIIEILGDAISKQYVQMTIDLMRRFGIEVENESFRRFRVDLNGDFRSPDVLDIEPDASSASYFFAAGMLGGRVKVRLLGSNSIQGDIKFLDAIESMGAAVKYGQGFIEVSRAEKIKAIDLDCNHIPDAAMTLAICACFADGTSRLSNIASWRVKECDRIEAMSNELRKFNVKVKTGDDFIEITPTEGCPPLVEIETYDDHRIAMCFSLMCLKTRLKILDHECVGKTFPEYFELFSQLM